MFFHTEDIPKTERIKLTKSDPCRLHLEFSFGKALMKSKYIELKNFLQTKDIPRRQQIKLTKSFPGWKHFEFNLGKALMKSKYVELMKFFPH